MQHLEAGIVKKTKFKIKIERVTEIARATDTPKKDWLVIKDENGRKDFGWVSHPDLKLADEISETMVLLEQELDAVDIGLVIRAINFPGDFGQHKEGQ